MCRLYGFRANEETKVECTLAHAQNALMLQSRADLRGKSHPDGWGVGVYHNTHPEIFRSAAAAYEDLHFNATVERLYSRTVLAHVRRATVGEPSLLNCHPFSHGHWTLAHNGTVTGFERLRDTLVRETRPDLQRQRRGVTDSEQVFYWLLSRMARANLPPEKPCRDLPALSRVVAASVVELAQRSQQAGADDPAQLNFLLSDGHILLATCWNHTLYLVRREGIRDCEICGIPHVHHQSATDYRAVVIASEPISQEPWRAVANKSLVAVDGTIRPEIQEIEALVAAP